MSIGPRSGTSSAGKSGHEVAHELRQGTWRAAIYLVALTGWGHEDDRHRAIESGFDWHLDKPVDGDSMMQLLAKINSVRRRS